MPYIGTIPAPFRRWTGAAEVLAGIGLILPALTHIRRREYPNIGFNLILLVLAMVMAYERLVIASL